MYIWIPFTIIAFGLICIPFVFCLIDYLLYRKAFKKVHTKMIVAVEPSIFRTAESFVLGPYSKTKAWIVANKIVFYNPYSAADIYPETCKVYLGDKMLWPKE